MVLGLRQKLGISVFIETAAVTRLLPWQHPLRCHFVSFVMHICGAKFQDHCLNSFRVIVFLVFYHFLVANLMMLSLISFAYYKNVNISETKIDISKRKTPFFRVLKGLSNKQKIFFMSYTPQGW